MFFWCEQMIDSKFIEWTPDMAFGTVVASGTDIGGPGVSTIFDKVQTI